MKRGFKQCLERSGGFFCGFIIMCFCLVTSVFAVELSGDIVGSGGVPDGKVDIFDYNLLVSKFGNPYTIFDYNSLVASFGQSTLSNSTITFDPSFSSSMVLQRDKPITISGTASLPVNLTVRLNSTTAQTSVDNPGRWSVTLPALAAGGPYTLTVTGGKEIQLTDIYIGDVYLCSGQSNMAMQLAGVTGGLTAIDRIIASNLPLRFLQVPTNVQLPRGSVVTPVLSWTGPVKAKLASFSGVCALVGEKLAHETQVPIGLIQSAIGGTPIEPWINYTDLATYSNATALVNILTSATSFASLPQEIRACADYQNAGVAFLGMIKPLKFHSLKGVIWYQGEGNEGRTYEYQFLLPLLTKSYRDHFHDSNLPFFVVQLPTFAPGHNWAEIRSVQYQASKTIPHLHTIPTLDLGSNTDIHPSDKVPVAERVASAILRKSYGATTPSIGPTYLSHTISGNEATVTFSLTDTGGSRLQSRTSTLGGFSVAGSDGIFYPATATLVGNTMVKVSTSQVSAPKQIRYAWSQDTLSATLQSDNGWPALPFRTDTLPFSTQNRTLADRPLWELCQ